MLYPIDATLTYKINQQYGYEEEDVTNSRKWLKRNRQQGCWRMVREIGLVSAACLQAEPSTLLITQKATDTMSVA
jgi:hypothetical protein